MLVKHRGLRCGSNAGRLFTPVNRKYAHVAGFRTEVKGFGEAVGPLPSISQEVGAAKHEYPEVVLRLYDKS